MYNDDLQAERLLCESKRKVIVGLSDKGNAVPKTE